MAYSADTVKTDLAKAKANELAIGKAEAAAKEHEDPIKNAHSYKVSFHQFVRFIRLSID